jgi:hypothetical protein
MSISILGSLPNPLLRSLTIRGNLRHQRHHGISITRCPQILSSKSTGIITRSSIELDDTQPLPSPSISHGTLDVVQPPSLLQHSRHSLHTVHHPSHFHAQTVLSLSLSLMPMQAAASPNLPYTSLVIVNVAVDARLLRTQRKHSRHRCHPNAVLWSIICDSREDTTLVIALFPLKDLTAHEAVFDGYHTNDKLSFNVMYCV